MKAFHTIAIPQKDVLEGRLSMDIFAADLWEVHNGRAPPEYGDPGTFFRKTFLTKGLNEILEAVKRRCDGRGGDPVIQLQTPFGGGKTHALIALYHKAKEWGCKTPVIVGTALNSSQTIWGEIERQLTGKINRFSGMTPPGKEGLRQLFEPRQPMLILVDELLQYVTKAAGTKVGDSNLASQTIAFIQEFLETVATLDRTCTVITLPSSLIEHYDQSAEIMFQQLQKVSGKFEKVYAPVQDDEITKVIRKRLFSNIDRDPSRDTVDAFVSYAEREGILPLGVDPSTYRERFLDSYPFMPEVIDVLYKQWGSLTTFQRTRGVLRLLAIVIHSLKDSNKPYISLADFDLDNSELRRELIKHIGNEYDSVISADITGFDSGSKIVDKDIGQSYTGLRLGTRSSTTIFLYSFSGGQERGARMNEIKRAATTLDNPSSAVTEAVNKLKGRLFYLQCANDKYWFSNKPNINRILLTKMENVKEQQIKELQRKQVEEAVGKKLTTYIWPREPKDVPDSSELKLVILDPGLEDAQKTTRAFIETKGESPRVYKNTMLFLSALESEKQAFKDECRKYLAYEMIKKDPTLGLEKEDMKNVIDEQEKAEKNLMELVKRLYRNVYVPAKQHGETGGVKRLTIGIPAFGDKESLDERVLNCLRTEGEICNRISPEIVKMFLGKQAYIGTKTILETMLKTPGETRPISPDALAYGIVEGVSQGLFGLGYAKGDRKECKYFPGDTSARATFEENEIIMAKEICERPVAAETSSVGAGTGCAETETTTPNKVTIDQGSFGSDFVAIPNKQDKKELRLEFEVPRGKVSDLLSIFRFLQSKFNLIRIELKASDGTISKEEYEDRIKEGLRQLGIELKDDS